MKGYPLNRVARDTPIRMVTAHDVARLAGVSQSAVSRAFSDGASVSRSTREKVLAAAKQIGYRPNLIASTLITGRSRLVGVAVPGLSNPFYAALVDRLSDRLALLGYRAMLFSTPHGASADPVLEDILSYQVDALVLVSAQLSSSLAEECHSFGLPVVMVNRKTDSSAVSSVTSDNVQGARKVARFLLSGGHQKFAYLAGLDSSSTSRDREMGFREELLSRGANTPVKVHGNYTVDVAARATRQLLNSDKRPDAIFCANDQMALIALDIARSEFGLNVGTELSIVGFDNTDIAEWSAFSLTTFSQSMDRMADMAVDIIAKKLSGADFADQAHLIDGKLVVRKSARIPPSGTCTHEGYLVWEG